MNNNKNNNEFDILRKINSNPKISQRNLASKFGISLGKLNYCIKSLKLKGLIKIKNFSRNPNKLEYAYLLTPRGVKYKSKMAYFFLKQKMKEYEDLKREIENKK